MAITGYWRRVFFRDEAPERLKVFLQCYIGIHAAQSELSKLRAKLRTHELGEKMSEGVVGKTKTLNTHLVAIYTIKFIVINF